MEPGELLEAQPFAGPEAAADSARLLFAAELADAEVEEILGRYALADPRKADAKIQEMAGPPATRHVFARLLPLLLDACRGAPEPDRFLVNLKRLSDVYAGRETLYASLAEDPQALSALVQVVSVSQFFADTLVRWPHLIVLLFDRDRLSAPRKRRQLKSELSDSLDAYQTHEGALDAIRAFKRRETLRIGIRDVTGRADILTITAELSDLADICVEAAYQLAIARLGSRPAGAVKARFAVIAMGKLGGRELNYSSDIDLMFVYDVGPSGDDSGDVHAYFHRLAETLVTGLAAQTAEGHAFRVDTGLRPEGRDGPLVRSLESYAAYYERWAQTWEFQALLKARAIAGDADLGSEFIAMVHPFVYRQTVAPDDIARIRAMKERVERDLESTRELYREVKLGFGGIRDIEFTVQLLQLAHGHGNARLRGGNTLHALSALAQARIITKVERDEIAESYAFLRTVEHRLQIMQSLQQHVLPEDPTRTALFARRLGYDEGVPGPAERFQADYLRHTSRVRDFFRTYFLAEDYGLGTPTLAALVAGNAPETAAADLLAPYGFVDPARAGRSLRTLVDAAGEVDAGTVAWGETVLAMAGQTPDPDAALARLSRFVAAMGSGPEVVRMLVEGPYLLDLLTRVFGTSEFLADELIRQPEFIDVLASPAAAFEDRPYPETVRGIRAETSRAEDHDAKLDALRHYKRRDLVRVGVRDLVGGADVRTVCEELTRLADACLREAYLLTEEHLAGELGMPRSSGSAVIGLGKLGGRELNYSSDLDVVFVYRGEGALGDGTSHTAFWTRLAEDLMAALAAPTAEGTAYHIDPNLRPEGRSGPLVRSLESYTQYYGSYAQVWERQALIRARPICGDIELAGDFMQMLQDVIYREGLGTEELEEIRHLKGRMERERLGKLADPARHVKLGPGGISDIEFTVQVLQLTHGREHRPVRRAETFEALRQLAKLGLLAPDDAKVLTRGLAFLRRVELRLQIVRKRPEHVLPEDEMELGRLGRRLGYHGDLATAGKTFERDYAAVTGSVRDVFVRLVGVS